MNKIVFFNTGWMRDYRGIKYDDSIIGGGDHIKREGWGSEIFNFTNLNNHYFGYVEAGGSIHIERLGADEKDDYIDDVLLVWTARRPKKGGTFIIGWYLNARIYRHKQSSNHLKKRKFRGRTLDYVAYAKATNSQLLRLDDRIVKVPRGKNGMGNRNVWYCENNPTFLELVSNYIVNNTMPENKARVKGDKKRKPNLERRNQVERAAIEYVRNYYEAKNYLVSGVENLNYGWDLEAIYNESKLLLEVKGQSSKEVYTELSPNEFKKMNQEVNKYIYRVCIVTNVLISPILYIFNYNQKNNLWVTENGYVLEFETVVKAKIKIMNTASNSS